MDTLPNALPQKASAPDIPRFQGQPPAPAKCARRACVPQLVTTAFELTPDSIALKSGSKQLTYAALHARANQLAGYLRSLGIGPDVPVGLCLERSFDYIVAALAVWKAGGIYLPIDPAWPKERRALVLKDAGASALITRGNSAYQAAYLIDLERDALAIAHSHPAFEPPHTKREHLAYIVYTSGSSGRPKGVEITHGNLLNMVFWHRRYYGVTSKDRASHMLGLGFDATMAELWPYLTAGASVALVEESARTCPDLLRNWIVAEGITISAVPSVLGESLIRAVWPAHAALRYLVTGGDMLHAYSPANLPFQVVNNYGPAECSVVACAGVVPAESGAKAPPPIGTPIANTSVYLLDENLKLVRPGVVGEIYIGGTSVGRGYRNAAELTAERFLEDPFGPVAGARMYRTGDLGCQLADGQIAFRGRIDSQVKIRGQRVELDEIISVLSRHERVAASAVIAQPDPSGDKRLVAYIVSRSNTPPSSPDLREFLSAVLPSYMIPSAFVRVDALPLNSNGKLDQSALPTPGPMNLLDDTVYRTPQSPVEISVANILAELFHLDGVGLDDNFFLLGGHSLLGTQLIVRMRERFGVEITLRDLFEAQTVENLSAVIERLLLLRLDAMTEAEAEALLTLQEESC